MTQLQAFAFTLACEVPLMLLLAHRCPRLRVLLAAAGINCLTHPVAWQMAMLLSPADYRSGLWWLEAAVVLVEAVCYRFFLRLGWPAALSFSALANAASLSLGWLVW